VTALTDLEELHDFDEPVVVTFLDLLHQTLVGLLDEVVEVGQALDHVVDLESIL
jgi:hypothetical protein